MRRHLSLLAALAVAAVLAAAVPLLACASTAPTGKHLYRQYCGKCHALSVALAAGFGTTSTALGGPSFNQLRVPYKYSIQAVTEPTGGHEKLRKQMSAKNVRIVALWLAKATRRHPMPALPTDG